MVHPDKRKGMIIIERGDDQLMHFKWKDRTSGDIEDDLIIFPDDIEFKRVTQCTTGRVYILKFKSNNRKLFFWMQEPKTDKDDEYCKKINDVLNNPPPPGSSSSRQGGSSGSGGGLGIPGLDLNNLGDSELQSLLNNMNQQQLMQLFGGSGLGGASLQSLLGGPSSSRTPGAPRRERQNAERSQPRSSDVDASPSLRAPTTTSTTSSSSTPAATTTTTTGATTTSSTSSGAAGGSQPPIQLSDLQSILSGIQVPEGASGGPQVDLASGINAEVLQPLLTNSKFVKRMIELLPKEEEGDGASQIKATVQSPQFQQALSMFSAALQSGQLAPLVREFELGDEAVAAATAGNMEAFVKAMQEKTKKEKDAEPEDMALD